MLENNSHSNLSMQQDYNAIPIEEVNNYFHFCIVDRIDFNGSFPDEVISLLEDVIKLIEYKLIYESKEKGLAIYNEVESNIKTNYFWEILKATKSNIDINWNSILQDQLVFNSENFRLLNSFQQIKLESNQLEPDQSSSQTNEELVVQKPTSKRSEKKRIRFYRI